MKRNRLSKWSVSQLDTERIRYNKYAQELQAQFRLNGYFEDGVDGIATMHQAPYLAYYENVVRLITSSSTVLEIGAGTGRHTSVIAKTGARVTALDISEVSLQVLKERIGGRVDTICASMDSIPIPNSSFDFIVSAGALSYADFEMTWGEFKRLLKPGGCLIILDTLNHNPVYRLNRFLQVLRGRRTFLTLTRMPKMSQLDRMRGSFLNSTIATFGEFYWALVVLKFFTRFSYADNVITKIESRRSPSKWSFKFLLVAENFQSPA